jgi:hypothetical protein
MAHALEPHVLEAFRADTRRIMSRRVPGASRFSWPGVDRRLIEVAYYPIVGGRCSWSFGLEIVLCCSA